MQIVRAHYSVKPLSQIVDKTRLLKTDMKPVGLWYSCENDGDAEWVCWRRWCTSEQFGSYRDDQKTIVQIDLARILILRSHADILHFHHKYVSADDQYRVRMRCIEWHRVADRFDGIEISPYIWSARFDDNAGWYYSWDCASGCIWNPRAIIAFGATELASGAAQHPTVEPATQGEAE